LGRTHIVGKYAASIPALIVEKEGVERVGTGFLVHDHYGGKQFEGIGYIVTARHNVDPADGIKFLRFGDSTSNNFKPIAAKWFLHPDRDIAMIPVRTNPMLSPIYPFGTAAVLSRTISLGYPTISSTIQPYLLAHNGELNAIVESYLDHKQYLLISNDVSPGNSGGPVLDDAGLCIGMVVRALEGEYDGGTSKANAAIPAKEIQEFLSSITKSIPEG
jgi:S1-C subfamily serine protease